MPNFQALLESAPLPDLRLRRRAAHLVQSMVRGQSANSLGCLSPADATQESFTRGAYRFFDNGDVTRTALHTPMQIALRELISPSETAIVAHDLSVLNYSGHNRKEDLIPVGNDRTWGYELFQSLVIKAGVPVGVAITELRCNQGNLSSQSDEEIPLGDHLEQAERAVDSVEQLLPERLLIHLLDREFDDVRLLRNLAERRYVIRYRNLSRIVAVHGERMSIWRHLESLDLQQSGEVTRRFAHSTQTYSLWLGETEVTMQNPSLRGVQKRKQKPQPGVPLRVRVVVSELRQPGEQPLRWVLLTNLKESTFSVVGRYLERWKIERLFYFEKIGFRLECWHQENAERIAKRLLLVQMAASAVYQLSQATHDKSIQVMESLAKLGGWTGRKQTPIGPTMLMRGALLFLGAMQLIQLHKKRDLFAMARILEPSLGQILRR
ncbi:MAG: hypothetical protein JNM40_14300 [Myxococcales bacterium]|jgi:hypothetical protein|nr:hypothetical protein [Myxococcales bacterium]